jgi:hypothetical protein
MGSCLRPELLRSLHSGATPRLIVDLAFFSGGVVLDARNEELSHVVQRR